MFKEKKETLEEKNKNEGFVDANGQELAPKAEEPKPEEKNPDDVDLNVEFTYGDSHLENIEKGRLEFLKVVKKENIIKWICAAFAIGLLIFSWIFIIGQLKNQPLGLSMCGVSILIIVAYYVLMKRYNAKKMNDYLKKYYGDMNSYVFTNPRFKNVNGDIAGKIDNEDFYKNNMYKDVSTVGSRNIINFKIDDKIDVKICDCAAQRSTTKKLEPVFIGKYLIANNTYQGDEPIYIYLPGNSRSLPPDNIDGITKVVSTRKLIIRTENKNYESTLTANVRNRITQLITNNILVDVSIAIHKGKTYMGLGYDDCLMVLPLQTKFNPIPIERFKKDMDIITEIVADLNK